MNKIIFLSLGILTTTLMNSQAAIYTWGGGTGSFTDANWTEVGVGAGQVHTSFTGNSHSTFINSGIVNGFNVADVGIIEGNSDQVTISGGAQVFGDYIQIGVNIANPIQVQDGSITLSDVNALRASSSFNGFINLSSIDATVTQTDLTGAAWQHLAAKFSVESSTKSYFRLNGDTVVSSVAYDGTNLAAVNADLATTVKNGHYFEITESGGAQTLHVRAVPEPSSMILLFAGAGLGLCRRQRR